MSQSVLNDALGTTKLTEALDRVEDISSYPSVCKGLIYWLYGKYDDAFHILDTSLQESLEEGRADVEFLVMIVQGLIHYDLENHNDFLDCYEQAELIYSINKFDNLDFGGLWLALYYRLAALSHASKQDWPEAATEIKNALQILGNLDYRRIKAILTFDAGWIHNQMNKANLSLSYFHELLFYGVDEQLSYRIYEQMADIHQYQGNLNISLYYLYCMLKSNQGVSPENSISIYTRIASIFITKGMYDDAESIVKITQKIYQDEGDEKGEIWSNFQFAISEYRKGNWQKALALFHENQDDLDKIEDLSLQGLVLKFIGDINRLKGDLQAAKENFMDAIDLFNQLADRWNLADVYNKLGSVYFQEGDKTLAHKNFQKSLAIFRKIGNSVRYSEPIFNLIRTKLDLDSIEQAEIFLSMLENISDRTDNELIHHRKRLARALILKSKKRIIDKVEAQKILTEFVKDSINDAELTILGMINLCDLLLAELHLYQEAEVLEEIHELSDKLVDISIKQRSIHIQVEALILKARLSLISGEISKTSNLLQHAEELSTSANLSYQSERIKEEKDTLMDQLTKWEYLNQKSSSIREKMEMVDIQNYMESLLSSK